VAVHGHGSTDGRSWPWRRLTPDEPVSHSIGVGLLSRISGDRDHAGRHRRRHRSAAMRERSYDHATSGYSIEDEQP
jgi:hypothetical protein